MAIIDQKPARHRLEIADLQVYYGHAHALQSVNLSIGDAPISVIGRNGMGKTTLCKAVMGLVPVAGGSIKFDGVELVGRKPHEIAAAGLGYVPQGRRVFPSLTVDEHLRLASKSRRAAWTVERVYDQFPRLYERRNNGGSALSGGEQQMLAIARALLTNPKALIMDEPTEGLAPAIVDQVEELLVALAKEDMGLLLVEQNFSVATSVSDRLAIMVNGQIALHTGSAELRANEEMQRTLLGVGARASHRAPRRATTEVARVRADAPDGRSVTLTLYRLGLPGGLQPVQPQSLPGPAAPAALNRWALGVANRAAPPPVPDQVVAALPPTRWAAAPAPTPEPTPAPTAAPATSTQTATTAAPAPQPEPRRVQSGGGRIMTRAYVVGTCDTKGEELAYVKQLVEAAGVPATLVDVGTKSDSHGADITARDVAAHHPEGAGAVFSDDRGKAVGAMADALVAFMKSRVDIGGVIGLGGSGNTALVTPAMRALPIGLPKIMVSTVASGNVAPYVGPSDIMMMYSVTDVAGINRISRQVLGNAAHAIAGMIANPIPASGSDKPAIGLTMFGVTTPCVNQMVAKLKDRYDCLVFHATGTGGQSMEKLVESGLVTGVIDSTTTEVCDLLMGGVFSAGEDRLGAFIRTGMPYVGSCGALDMVNFGAMETVPAKYRNRNLYVHNPQVTLMRTTPAENIRMGQWIAARLNQMQGPVRFLIPEKGVSMIDAPGMPFHDPAADDALFRTLESEVQQTAQRRLIRLPHNVNDPEFSDALVEHFLETAR